MSALTDVFVATEDAARAFAATGAPFGPAAGFDSVELPGVEVALLDQLARALRAAPVVDQVTLVGEPPEAGPWVLALPASLVVALADLDEESAPAVVERWAAAPEWRPRDPKAEVLGTVLEALMALARRAKSQAGASLYLWWSL